MERHLILFLAVAAVGIGSSAAVLRPGLFQLGQATPPPLGSGVSWRSGAAQNIERRGGGGLPRGGRARWERFQGRGPGGAK